MHMHTHTGTEAYLLLMVHTQVLKVGHYFFSYNIKFKCIPKSTYSQISYTMCKMEMAPGQMHIPRYDCFLPLLRLAIIITHGSNLICGKPSIMCLRGQSCIAVIGSQVTCGERAVHNGC